MKLWINVVIFVLQFSGVILVGIGLAEIWNPLALIYAGIAEFIFGNLLYRVIESEEHKA